MPQAGPLEEPVAGIMQPMLESLQSHLKVAQRLSTLLLAQSDDTVGSAVAEHLAHMEDHVADHSLGGGFPVRDWPTGRPCVREAKS